MSGNEQPANTDAIAEKVLALAAIVSGNPDKFYYATGEKRGWNNDGTSMVFRINRIRNGDQAIYDKETDYMIRLERLINNLCGEDTAFYGKSHTGDLLGLNPRTPDIEAKLDALIAAEKARDPQAERAAEEAARANINEITKKLIPTGADGNPLDPEAAAKFIAGNINALYDLARNLGVDKTVKANLSSRTGRGILD